LAALRISRRKGLTVLAWVLGVAEHGNAADQHPEYNLKAAFLINFARMIEWPENAWPAGGSPVNICVAGSGDAFDAIESEIRDSKVDNHPVRVRSYTAVDDASGCQILFVGDDIGVPDRARLQVQHRSGTLTVGESTGFASRGGVIGFFRDGTRIRFEINRTAAREVGVRISSRLLRLAKLTETED
jgi:hypothetical protein